MRKRSAAVSRRACAGLLMGLLAYAAAPPARAAGKRLEAIPFGKVKLRIDGDLREWPAKLDDLSRALSGSAGGVTGCVGYDADHLYVGMRIRDERLVRSAALGKGEDAAELVLAFPTGRSYRTHVVRLYAGRPGKTKGSVRLGTAAVPGAKLVEAPSAGGYDLEAAIPWKTFPEASTVRVALRAALRYEDADRPGHLARVVSTSDEARGADLPPLLFEGEVGLYQSLISAHGLKDRPDRLALGNVVGDRAQEAVAVYGNYLTITGSGYRGGTEFFFQDLGVPDARAVTRLDLRDLTGDGHAELIVQKRVGESDHYRELLQVLRVGDDGAPSPVLEQEVAVVGKGFEVRNAVTVTGQGKAARIDLEQDVLRGVEPATYAEPKPGGSVASALLPWETVLRRSYGWDGTRLAVVGEKTGEAKLPPPGSVTSSGPATRSATHDATHGATRGATHGAAGAGPPRPPAPRPPMNGELLDEVYALYRKDRKIGKSKPSFDFVTDVAGDANVERVLVHGSDIVVFGKAFRQGLSYVYLSMGFDAPEQVLDATALDLTGDGKAELLVRGLLEVESSKELGSKHVQRHALFVYSVQESGITRVFAAETGRSMGDAVVLGTFSLRPGSAGFDLELGPGRAQGWTRDTYPFPADRQPYGGLEPLLLPWTELGVRHYVFDGAAYSQR